MAATVESQRRPRRLARLFWNSAERRPRALWRLLGQLALCIAGILLLGLLGALLARAATGQATATPFFVAAAGAALLAIVGGSWLAARWLDRRRFADFGFHLSRGWWLDLAFGLALGALLMSGIFLAERAAGWVRVAGTFYAGASGLPFWLAILAPLAIFVCVGIYEELLARGYQLRNLAEGFNARWLGPRGGLLLAWALSSALFGLAHAANPNATAVSSLCIMLAGMVLGLGYVLTGELAISIGLHISWNFFQGNVFGFPVSGTSTGQATFIAIEQGGPLAWTGGAFGPEAGLIGIAALLAGALLIVAWVRWRTGRLALRTALAIYEARA